MNNYYVSSASGSDKAAGSFAAPWKTIGRAVSNRAIGDCVNVEPGTYTEAVFISPPSGTGFSGPTGYFVLRSETPGGAMIVSPTNAGVYNVMTIKSSYVIVDGFDVNGQIASGGATGSCIDEETQVSTGTQTFKGLNHIQILNNTVHDCGGSGIQLDYGDLYTVTGNTAYNNACCNKYQMSGISIYEPTYDPTATNGLDAYLTYRIDVSNNVAFNNFETNTAAAAGKRTDGNGIIIDTFQNTQRAVPGPNYTQPTRVSYNLVYFNGGGGIEVTSSDNVLIDHNTSFNNRQDTGNSGTWRGDITAASSNNIVMQNNVAYAVPVAGTILAYNTAYLFENGANLTFTSNLSFNGVPGQASLSTSMTKMTLPTSNMLGVNPVFTSTVWPNIALQPLTSSPIFNAGIGYY